MRARFNEVLVICDYIDESVASTSAQHSGQFAFVQLMLSWMHLSGEGMSMQNHVFDVCPASAPRLRRAQHQRVTRIYRMDETHPLCGDTNKASAIPQCSDRRFHPVNTTLRLTLVSHMYPNNTREQGNTTEDIYPSWRACSTNL